MTPIHKALEDWKLMQNQAFVKDFTELSFSIAEGESLFRITVSALVRVGDYKEQISATRFFVTHSNGRAEYVLGDLHSLRRILDQVEQDFLSKVSDVIEKRLSGGI